MHRLVLLLLLTFIAPSAAQDPPRSVKTIRVEGLASTFYRVGSDGTVEINWRAVETAAISSDLSKSDIARAFIAIRDGSWKTMQ